MNFSCSEIVLRKIEQIVKLWNTFKDKIMKSYQLRSVIVLFASYLACYFPRKVYQKCEFCLDGKRFFLSNFRFEKTNFSGTKLITNCMQNNLIC
jgi:hypothetical protein